MLSCFSQPLKAVVMQPDMMGYSHDHSPQQVEAGDRKWEANLHYTVRSRLRRPHHFFCRFLLNSVHKPLPDSDVHIRVSLSYIFLHFPPDSYLDKWSMSPTTIYWSIQQFLLLISFTSMIGSGTHKTHSNQSEHFLQLMSEFQEKSGLPPGDLDSRFRNIAEFPNMDKSGTIPSFFRSCFVLNVLSQLEILTCAVSPTLSRLFSYWQPYDGENTDLYPQTRSRSLDQAMPF